MAGPLLLLASFVNLLCFASVLGDAGAKAPAPAVAAHAAAAALAALDDAQRLKEQIAEDERQRIVDDATNPLETYEFLDESLGLLMDTMLAALRHAVAATAGSSIPGSALLAEAANLEEQLNSLLAAQAKEPLFFWHGPKWLALSKLRRLIGRGAWHQKLQALAASSTSIVELVGEARALSAEAPVEGPVPPVGLAVDDSFCKEGGDCNLLAELRAAAAAAEKAFPERKVVVHLIVLPCSKVTMQRIGAALRSAGSELPQLYLSLSSPHSLFFEQEGQKLPDPAQLIKGYVAESQKALGPASIDLVWLPYAAFKKQHWPSVRGMLEAHPTWAYGAHAEVPSVAVTKKLLVDRSPPPAAWLLTDDLLRPAMQEAVQAARGAGIACISLPRANKASGALAAYYFQQAGLLAAEANKADAVAAQLHWSWHRGLAGTLRGGALAAPAELQSTEKARWKSQLLGAVALAAMKIQAGKGEFPPASSPVEAALVEGTRSLQQAEAGDASSAMAQEQNQDPELPRAAGVSASTLTGLAGQAEKYKENDHVIYKENFFDDETFAAIKAETQRLWRSQDIEANCNLDGKNRLGGYILDHIQHNSSLYNLIYGNEPFRRWVSAVNNEGPMWPSDFPIELREYGRESRGMGCHPDLQMYKVPKKDLEFAFTVDNDSRCNVTFWDAAGKQHLVQTKANSMMMVRVNAARHCVSSTEGGTRSIIKFIYVGDYRKSNDFWFYTSNECGANNPNRRMLIDRRAERAEEARTSLEL